MEVKVVSEKFSDESQGRTVAGGQRGEEGGVDLRGGWEGKGGGVRWEGTVQFQVFLSIGVGGR